MISTLEIGIALSAPLLVLAYALFQPRLKPAPIRVRDARPASRPERLTAGRFSTI